MAADRERAAPRGGTGTRDQLPALVGRDHEMAILEAALERAAAGSLAAVSLTGEAGIGKSRLAVESAKQARDRGMVVASGRAGQTGGAPPYWPWTLALRSLIDELGADEVVSASGENIPFVALIVPELSALAPAAISISRAERERLVLFDAVRSLLQRIAHKAPLALVLDDLHLADESTNQLLEFVLVTMTKARLAIVVCAEETRVSDPVSSLLSSFAQEHTAIGLSKLSRDDIAELCGQITNEPVAQEVVDAVFGASEGNPFFALEAMRLIKVEGDLHRPDYSLGFRVPKNARAVTRRRLAPLSNETRLFLSVGAVLGREFDVSVVAEVCGEDFGVVIEALSDAVSAGIISEVSTLGRFGFDHVLLRETLYEELSLSDRLRLHEAVARDLERRYRDDLEYHVDTLAHHYFKAAQAGDKAKTLDYAIRAARKATTAMAYEEAARLYRRALKVVEMGGVPGASRAQVTAGLEKVEALKKKERPLPARSGINLLRRDGEYWTVAFDDSEARLRDSKGLRYLAHLLSHPQREFHVLELVSLMAGSSPSVSIRTADPDLRSGAEHLDEVLDPTALAAYKDRIKELNDDLEEARSFNDPERAARAQMEIDALTDQLSKATGLGGQSRKIAGESERARWSVSKAIRIALRHLVDAHPSLGRHLEATVKTGTFCSYEPDERINMTWDVR